jgi:hypothetical protein
LVTGLGVRPQLGFHPVVSSLILIVEISAI